MSDDKRSPKDSGNNGANNSSSERFNGSAEKSSLPDYKYTPPPPANEKPSNKK